MTCPSPSAPWKYSLAAAMKSRLSVSNSTLWIGSKLMAGSWMFTSSTSAKRAGWVSRRAGVSAGLRASQHFFAVARL